MEGELSAQAERVPAAGVTGTAGRAPRVPRCLRALGRGARLAERGSRLGSSLASCRRRNLCLLGLERALNHHNVISGLWFSASAGG